MSENTITTPTESTPKARRTKSASKKTKKAKKQVASGPRGKLYVVKSEDKLAKLLEETRSPQTKFVLKTIKGRTNGIRMVELAEKAEAAGQETFPCTQPYKRAVAFILVEAKKAGAITFAKEAA